MNGEGNPTTTPDKEKENAPPKGPIESSKNSPSGENEKAPSRAQAGEPQKVRLIEWLQFIVNALLAVVGICAVIVYGGQLGVMKGQLTQMQQDSLVVLPTNLDSQGLGF